MHFIQDGLRLVSISIVQNQTRIHKVYKQSIETLTGNSLNKI